MLEEAGLTAQSKRCQTVEGIGPLTAAALNMAFLRGEFRNSDAFIAFIGLDVRLKESGRYSGRRKLTKQGYCTTPPWPQPARSAGKLSIKATCSAG